MGKRGKDICDSSSSDFHSKTESDSDDSSNLDLDDDQGHI